MFKETATALPVKEQPQELVMGLYYAQRHITKADDITWLYNLDRRLGIYGDYNESRIMRFLLARSLMDHTLKTIQQRQAFVLRRFKCTEEDVRDMATLHHAAKGAVIHIQERLTPLIPKPIDATTARVVGAIEDLSVNNLDTITHRMFNLYFRLPQIAWITDVSITPWELRAWTNRWQKPQ